MISELETFWAQKGNRVGEYWSVYEGNSFSLLMSSRSFANGYHQALAFWRLYRVRGGDGQVVGSGLEWPSMMALMYS